MGPTAAKPAAEQYRAHLERLEHHVLLALSRADRATATAPALDGAVAHHALRAVLWRARCRAGAMLGRNLGEMALEQLLGVADWSHPNQILDPPRPSLGELLRACRDDETSTTPNDRRAAVEDRLARLASIEATASRRRTLVRLGSWLGAPPHHEENDR